MVNPPKRPVRLTDFKGKPPRVEVSRESKDEADYAATKGLIDRYTQPDGWHCPRCNIIITNQDEIVEHLAYEINKALDHLAR